MTIPRFNNELPAYELIHRGRSESQPIQPPFESEDDFEKPTSRLPPKPLQGRRRYRPFVFATLIAVTAIVPLAILLRCIPGMLPHVNWDGLKLHDISCDLVDTQNTSRVQTAFTINLRGAAHLSFAEAKFVDLLFDLVLGQGGRLLLGALSYIVFMDALLRFMEITPVSFKLYTSLVFAPSSLISTWRSAKAIFTTRGWRGKMYLIWCVLAMAYVLAFPTLIESATGYVQPSSAGFNINNNFITADSDDLLNCFNITGGLLLGLDKNVTTATGPPVHVFDGPKNGYYRGYDSYRYADSSDHGPQLSSSINKTSLYYQLITCKPSFQFFHTKKLIPCLQISLHESGTLRIPQPSHHQIIQIHSMAATMRSLRSRTFLIILPTSPSTVISIFSRMNVPVTIGMRLIVITDRR